MSTSSLAPRPRRLRAAVAAVALAVAGSSGVWLASYADPGLELARVVVDAADAPRDASSGEFCRAYGSPGELDADASLVSRVNQLRGHAADLAEVGTPDDVPLAARRGFVAYVEASGGVTAEEVRSITEGQRSLAAAFALRAGEADDVGVFAKYAAATCFTPARSASPA